MASRNRNAKGCPSKMSAAGKGKNGGSGAKESAGSSFRSWIALLVILAACIFLFISNFGIGGFLGEKASFVSFGLFGLAAYIFPVCFFIGAVFFVINRGNGFAYVIKLVAGVVFLLFLCQLLEMIWGEAADFGVVDAFLHDAENRTGGGAVGGLLASLLCPAVGVVGAYVIDIALLIISFVLIAGNFFRGRTKRDGRKKRGKAKEETEEQQDTKERRREGGKPRRMDKKVAGVSFDTRIPPENAASSGNISELKAPDQPSPADPGPDDLKELAPEEEEKDLDEFVAEAISEPVVTEKVRRTPKRKKPPEPVREEGFPSLSIPGFDEPEPFPEYGSIGKIEGGGEGQRADASREMAAAPGIAEGLGESDVYGGIPPLPDGTEMEARPAALMDSPRNPGDAKDPLDDDIDDILSSILSSGDATQAGGARDARGQARWDMGPGSDSMAELDEASGANANGAVDAAGQARWDMGPGMDSMAEIDEASCANAGGAADAAGQASQDLGLGPDSMAEIDEAFGANTNGAGGAATADYDPESAAGEPGGKPYVFPPVSLLEKGGNEQGDSEKNLQETALKLQQILKNFGVNVTITDVSCGPSVTRYELQPEMGVKVSKIVNLADDIKLNLAATDIRIEAPIPGKAAVGIEVPNKEKVMVRFRDMIESEEFRNHKSNICFTAGKDIGGKVIVADIAKMPHLLIAGATGSGKSVCINTIIMSILYKANPEDVKLILIDPKVVELSVYNGIPHLLIPVVTDPKKAAGALHWAVSEMTDRYQKFSDYQVRDLKGYNRKVEAISDVEDGTKPQKMPQIVVIVDELADLMMVAPGDVEDAICRLAQLARAAGIHLIIATQRPSVDVITGLIKANMPSRIAFSVSSGIDSRTILDMVGAEKLLGNGDMLFYPQGYPKPLRVQGPFVSDTEVEAVVDFLKQQSMASYDEAVTEKVNSASVGNAGNGPGGGKDSRDDYFVEAGKFVIEKEKATIGMLQRMFRVGFNRAARIMDQLEEAGVVSAEEGTKPRKILMSPEEFEEYVAES